MWGGVRYCGVECGIVEWSEVLRDGVRYLWDEVRYGGVE